MLQLTNELVVVVLLRLLPLLLEAVVLVARRTSRGRAACGEAQSVSDGERRRVSPTFLSKRNPPLSPYTPPLEGGVVRVRRETSRLWKSDAGRAR